MATKKKETVTVTTEQIVVKYKGIQLLKMDKYNNRIARIVIDPENEYSFEEVDTTINKYLEKRG